MSIDNVCRYLSEEYPKSFATWLLGRTPADVKDLKTELSVEPVRADCIILLNPQEEILHLEFQVAPVSVPPMPIRMLDYYARLRRQYSFYPIEQVVIYLKETTANAVFIEQFTDTNTVHRFRSIRIWEQDPAPLLASVGLLPLAVLARTDSPESLLSQVAAQVDMIEEPSQQRNISACTQLLAGLKYDNNLISSLLREELMQESVVYQRIIRQGIEQGIEQGRREEALSVVMRQLPRRIGIVAPELRSQIEALSLTQLEDLSEALLDFSTATDLINWLNNVM
ncbi:Rpn family recombination-promoting nuclease/putative transposase [Nostoc sp. CALU 1950]|uniref:Rpn family recombination-promoting nuclease/putative transposase n=1 Tax=Nostoc sp. CALU 1950 TaxID=3104321 RepID=UPI003EBE89DB